MEENTIFKGNTQVQQGAVPVQPSSAPAPSVPPPPFSPASPFPQKPQGKSSFNLLNILLIVIILAGIIFSGFVFFRSSFFTSFFKEKERTVTLEYWGLWEDESVVKSVISDFEKENPNIKIVYEKQDIKGYRERVQTQIVNGAGPDIFRLHNTWLPMFSSYLSPLPSSVIENKDFQKWYYPAAQKDLTRNGAIYAIPLEIDTLALFVNTEMFQAAGEEAPKDWDEFIRVARKLTVRDVEGRIKTAGAALGTYGNVTHAPDIISLLFVQNGANLKDLSRDLSKPITEDPVTDTFIFYSAFAQGDEKTWDDTLDPSMLAFSKGMLAMYFGYSWDIFLIKAANPNLSFEIHPVPLLNKKNITIASYWAEGVSVKSKRQKEALLFLKFLSQKETQQKLYTEASKTRLFGEPYSRVDLAETLKDNPLVYPFVSQAQGAVSSFFASDTLDNGLNTEANSYLANAVNSVLINTSAQTAVKTLSQGVSQVLKKYGAL